jgi:diguanylate cyclase (GGDEF)-like protein
MRAAVRPGDTVARLGGDEFVVLCEDIGDEAVARAVSARVAEAVGEPYRVGGLEVRVHVSVGLAVAEPARRDPEDLLRLADAEMYRVKRHRREREAAPASPPSGS